MNRLCAVIGILVQCRNWLIKIRHVQVQISLFLCCLWWKPKTSLDQVKSSLRSQLGVHKGKHWISKRTVKIADKKWLAEFSSCFVAERWHIEHYTVSPMTHLCIKALQFKLYNARVGIKAWQFCPQDIFFSVDAVCRFQTKRKGPKLVAFIHSINFFPGGGGGGYPLI